MERPVNIYAFRHGGHFSVLPERLLPSSTVLRRRLRAGWSSDTVKSAVKQIIVLASSSVSIFLRMSQLTSEPLCSELKDATEARGTLLQSEEAVV